MTNIFVVYSSAIPDRPWLSFYVFYIVAKQTGPDEVEFVPLEDQNGGPIIVDTGSWFGPFDGLFESLAGN